MFENFFAETGEWIRGLLQEAVLANMANLYSGINEGIGAVAEETVKTPQAWNADIYGLVKSLSETVMMPVAGIVITYVLCYELISMVMEKNTMHDIDTWMFFRYIIKAWIAVYVASHSFELSMAVFSLGGHLAERASRTASASAAVDTAELAAALEEKMKDMGTGELIALTAESMAMKLGIWAMYLLITVTLYVRAVDIYLYVSVCPVPFATFSNREWGSIGNNYLRGLFARAFQAFFIMTAVGIYSVLVTNTHMAEDLHAAMFGSAAYAFLLCLMLVRMGGFSQSVFGGG